MKTNLLLVVIIALLITSCSPATPAEEIEVTNDVPTEVTMTEPAVTEVPLVTQEPTATVAPTMVPTETPPGCVALLTPPDGAELTGIGKVTFSWSPMKDARFYVLNITVPSGESVSFQTKQTFRGQYMEAFSVGGEYQWQVIVQDRKQHEICSSELATFNKPASAPPRHTANRDRKKK